MSHRLAIPCFWILILLASPTVPSDVWAQNSVSTRTPAAKESTKSNSGKTTDHGLSLELDILTVGSAALSGSSGRFAFSRSQVDATFHNFTLGYALRVYEWDKVDLLPFGNGRDDPFTDIGTVALKYRKKGPLSGRWRYSASGEISSSFEKQPESPSLDILAAIGYDFSSRFKVRMGAALFLHEVRSAVVPLAAFKFWGGGKSADEPLFSIDVGLPETIVSYHHSPRWEFIGSFLADSTVSDLSDGNPTAGGGFVETRDIVIGLKVKYIPTLSAALSAGLGYDIFRRLRFYDPNGNEIADYDVDGALTGRLTIAFRF